MAMIRSTKAAQKELLRVSLVHPPFPIELCVRNFRRSLFELEVRLTVPDTNNGDYRNQTLVFECALPVSRHKFIRFVETAMREAAMHELYESLHVDGKRVRDPHEGHEVGRAHWVVEDMRCFTRVRSQT